jgi:hypothetical protein
MYLIKGLIITQILHNSKFFKCQANNERIKFCLNLFKMALEAWINSKKTDEIIKIKIQKMKNAQQDNFKSLRSVYNCLNI